MIHYVDVIGQTVTLPDLGPGTWEFGLQAVDLAGQRGTGARFNTTVDATPPTAPDLGRLYGYLMHDSLTLSWTPSIDNGSGIDFYRVFWRIETFNGTTVHADTEETSMTLSGFSEGVTYWFWVRAYDEVGNYADSEEDDTEFDNTAPPRVVIGDLPEYINTTSIRVWWPDVRDNGVGHVRYWLKWRSLEFEDAVWGDYEGGDSYWIEDNLFTVTGLKDGVTYAFYVDVEDGYTNTAEESEHVYVTVDLSPPVIEFDRSIEGSPMSGIISINGTINESTPALLSMIHSTSGDWGYLHPQDTDTILEQGWFSFPWDTTQVPDGVTVIKVIVRDALGRQTEADLNITIRNGKPLVSRKDIWISDTEPLMGEEVTVMVKVRNDGGRVVEDLRLEVYDRDAILFVDPSVTVGPYSENVYWFRMRVVSEHNITARAFSDLHDTGEMEDPVPLKAVKEEVDTDPESEPIPWLAMLAIVLSVIAIALNLADRRREEAPGVEEKEIWVDSKDGEG
jgi:hypothetical protein